MRTRNVHAAVALPFTLTCQLQTNQLISSEVFHLISALEQMGVQSNAGFVRASLVFVLKRFLDCRKCKLEQNSKETSSIPFSACFFLASATAVL